MAKFGRPDELCILLPSPRVASNGKDFLAAQNPPLPSRVVEFVICPSFASLPTTPTVQQVASSSRQQQQSSSSSAGVEVIELQILLFDKAHWPMAKAFWQHTGDGISSRLAERALAFLGETPAGAPEQTSPTAGFEKAVKQQSFSRNRHYSRKPAASTPATPSTPLGNLTLPTNPVADDDPIVEETLTSDLTTYLEERYGRNLPLFNAPLAKQALKRRIAGGLLPSDEGFGQVDDVVRGAGAGKRPVREDDVYLYPCGMSAIWHAHDISRIVRRRKGEPEGKSVCYG